MTDYNPIKEKLEAFIARDFENLFPELNKILLNENANFTIKLKCSLITNIFAAGYQQGYGTRGKEIMKLINTTIQELKNETKKTI